MSTEDEKLLKEAKKLPWEERLLHKNWKVRNDANIDLASVCDSIMDPKDSRLKEFGERYNRLSAILMNLQSVRSLISLKSNIFVVFQSAPLFKKTVADSNAPVQEKALDALIAFLKAADADASRYDLQKK
jgi:cytoskeleton-associated protein 5